MSATALAPTVILMTAEEYRVLPDDGRHTELVLGRIVEMPPTNFITVHCYLMRQGIISNYVEGSQTRLGHRQRFRESSPSVIRIQCAGRMSLSSAILAFQENRRRKGIPKSLPNSCSKCVRLRIGGSAINRKAGEYLAAGSSGRLRSRPRNPHRGRLHRERLAIEKNRGRRIDAAGSLPRFQSARAAVLRMRS